MRLFIALPAPEHVRQALEETQAALKKAGVRGRFTPPENLHLTLAFLGNVADPAPAIEATDAEPAEAEVSPAEESAEAPAEENTVPAEGPENQPEAAEKEETQERM